MKKTIYGLLSSVIILSSLYGCASVGYKSISYEVLQPAQYTLPSWADTVLVVNAATQPIINDSTIDTTHTVSKQLVAEGGLLMPKQLVVSICGELNSSGYIAARGITNPMSLTAQGIDSLLKNHPTTIIISLSSLRVASNLDLIDDMTVDMTCVTHVGYELITNPQVRVPFISRDDTLVYRSYGATVQEMVEKLPRILDKYEELGITAGQKVSGQIIPTWQRFRRTLYISNNPHFAAADKWIEQNRWDEARNLWVELFGKSRKNIEKVHAALNTALSYEREDEAVKASMWCSKTLDIIENASSKERQKMAEEERRARQMFGYNMRRLEQLETLDKQMQQ